MAEEWKDIEGFEGIYQVSNRGRVKRIVGSKRAVPGQILRPFHDKAGYLRVDLFRDGKRTGKLVHRLVLEEHVGSAPSPKHEGNHKSGGRDDNCVENLEWVTRSENMRHAYDVLGFEAARGEASSNASLTRREVIEIRKLWPTGKYLQRELAEMFGVTHQTISRIVRRETWQHVP